MKIMNNFLKGKKVAVVMGGPGAEREVSLRSGLAVAKAVAEAGADSELVDVIGTDVVLPAGIDLVFNMIHGTFGEDGALQEILDRLGVPYTGEGAEGSRVAFDKILSKERFAAAGVPTSAWSILRAGEPLLKDPPFVLKAPRQGSSVGVHIVKTPAQAKAALDDCLRFGEQVLLEDFFVGRELTVGILGDIALPVVEIVPHEGFYDYEHKYTKGASDYFVPAPIGEDATRAVQKAALEAHRALSLEVYSRVDILLAADGSLNVMEINTIPGMTETSLLPKAASVIGLSFPALCDRIAEISHTRFS